MRINLFLTFINEKKYIVLFIPFSEKKEKKKNNINDILDLCDERIEETTEKQTRSKFQIRKVNCAIRREMKVVRENSIEDQSQNIEEGMARDDSFRDFKKGFVTESGTRNYEM